MAVSAVDSHKISIVSTEVIPADTLFKTYNFLVWIDSTIVNASSKLEWSVRVYDTCAAFYKMIWDDFSDGDLVIGS